MSPRIALLTVFACCLPLAAQTGSITGQVSDPSGASIPDAGVTVTNIATGVATQTRTNAEGYYTVPFLTPGDYRITTTKEGFKTASRSPVKLDVNQIARIDFSLTLGAQTEQVNVTSTGAPLVQTETAALGQVIGDRTVVDLPLNGRNFTQLTTLTPGAYTAAPTGFVRGSTVVANGMRTSNTVFSVNGINTTDQDFEGTANLPPPDAIQEFKVQTNDLEAQYGLGGAVISVELRPGTNAFHGSLYEFLRNEKLDARNFFALTKSQLRQNQFGGMLGGPIIKDKTFFFIDYQGTRIHSGQTFNDVVPSAAMQAGNFAGQKAIVDPTTGAPFPGNVIPSGRIAPQSAFFLKFFPLPNTPQGTFVYNGVGINNADQFDVRVDHQLRAADSLRFTYLFTQPTVYVPGSFPDNGAVSTDLRHQAGGVSEVHTFSPHIINEATLGYTRIRSFGAQQGLGTNYTTQAGIGGFDVTSGAYPGFPGLTPTGYTALTNNPFQPLRFRENNYNLRDVVTIVKGSHIILAGFEFTRHSNFTTNSAHNRGEFTFSGTYTGNAWGDYLLGLPFQGSRSFPRDLFGYYMTEFEPFVQDNWKVTRRLTLNLGLRYSWFPQPSAMHNVLSSVDPIGNRIVVASDSQGRIQTGAQQVASLVFPLFQDIIVPSSKVGLDNTLRQSNDRNFGPRLGLAWQPGGGLVVRAGYGIIYSLFQGVQYEGTVAGANLPFFADQTGFLNTTPVPSLTLANFFPPISAGNFSLPPLTIYQLDPHAPNPYFQQWNFTLQKVLGGAVSVEAAYVGNKGTHLTFSEPINIPLPAAGAVQARRPNPRFSSGALVRETDSSIYNALQTKVETRFWRGLSFLGTYTWAKGLDYQSSDSQVSPVQDPNNIRAERGITSQPASNFTVSAVYELPFLKSRRGFVGAAFGGWEMTSIFTAQSGGAFTPIISTDPANTGTSKRPNRIADGGLSNPGIDRWFNVAAFQVPALYTFGNSGVNILRGPGMVNWDAGLFKNFPVRERMRLQFRAEFFNTTNTPHFANPNANIQAPAAGRILAAGTPRQIQFALKLLF
jgi:hypothetical protein